MHQQIFWWGISYYENNFSSINIADFQTSMLMKLDSIIENQKEILVHLPHKNVGIESTCNRELDDCLARPMNSVNEVGELCSKLEQAAFSKTLVMLKKLFFQSI